MYAPHLGRFLQTDPVGYNDHINPYIYCGNNPIINFDPSGKWLETLWDAANVVTGAVSLVSNVRQGKWGWAALDAVGLVADVVATAVPFLPGGVSAGIKAARAGNKVMDAVNVGADVAKIAKKTNKAAKVVDNTSDAMTYGRKVHNAVGDTVGKLKGFDANFVTGSNKAFGIQADFSNKAMGVWADVTTPGSWGTHVRKYSGTFGEGIPILYQRGQGVVDMARLRSGAGFTLTAAQYWEGCDQWSGGGLK
jgi:hypothetical protein